MRMSEATRRSRIGWKSQFCDRLSYRWGKHWIFQRLRTGTAAEPRALITPNHLRRRDCRELACQARQPVQSSKIAFWWNPPNIVAQSTLSVQYEQSRRYWPGVGRCWECGRNLELAFHAAPSRPLIDYPRYDGATSSGARRYHALMSRRCTN